MKKQAKLICIFLIILSILIILITSALLLIKNFNPDAKQLTISPNTAVRIIDGDTFELANGDIVRLVCVDTPEKGKEGYEEATDFLFSLIYNKEVRLEKDVEDKDIYGRLLRYVYINATEDNEEKEIFVNKEIVKQGYGDLFLYGNNTAKCGEIGEENENLFK